MQLKLCSLQVNPGFSGLAPGPNELQILDDGALIAL